jgi:hypothetical protein
VVEMMAMTMTLEVKFTHQLRWKNEGTTVMRDAGASSLSQPCATTEHWV